MNTEITAGCDTTSLTRHVSRRAALAACLALLFAGAAACAGNADLARGTGTPVQESRPNAATSIDLIERAKANPDRAMQQLRAERWHARKAHESQGQKRNHQPSTEQHPAGFSKALIAEQ